MTRHALCVNAPGPSSPPLPPEPAPPRDLDLEADAVTGQDAWNLCLTGAAWLMVAAALAATLDPQQSGSPRTQAALFGGMALLFPLYATAVLASSPAPERLARESFLVTLLSTGALLGMEGLAGLDGVLAGALVASWAAGLTVTALALGEVTSLTRAGRGGGGGVSPLAPARQVLVTAVAFLGLGLPIGILIAVPPGPFAVAAVLVAASRLTYPPRHALTGRRDRRAGAGPRGA